jgi:hypothetical protein
MAQILDLQVDLEVAVQAGLVDLVVVLVLLIKVMQVAHPMAVTIQEEVAVVEHPLWEEMVALVDIDMVEMVVQVGLFQLLVHLCIMLVAVAVLEKATLTKEMVE